jgi:hypothetical protein
MIHEYENINGEIHHRVYPSDGELSPKNMNDILGAHMRLFPPCCERDDDGDGNCDIHSSPGVLRKSFA